MKFAIFAKKRTTKEGKQFISYIGKLKMKSGEEVTATIRFAEGIEKPNPAACPMIIEVEKENSNMSTRTYTDADTGEKKTGYTLWAGGWKDTGEVFVDHSLDDFE